MEFLRGKWGVVAAVLVVVVFVASFVAYVSLGGSTSSSLSLPQPIRSIFPLSSAGEADVAGATISFVSQIPGATVDEKSIDAGRIDSYLKAAGLTNIKEKLSKNGNPSIRVIFASPEQYLVDKQANPRIDEQTIFVVDINDILLRFMRMQWIAADQRYDAVVYVDLAQVRQQGVSIDLFLTDVGLQEIFWNLYGQSVSGGVVEFWSARVGDTISSPIFRVQESQGLLRRFFSFISGKVYAQTCGWGECGYKVQQVKKACTYPGPRAGQSCSSNAFCCPINSNNCTSTCQTNSSSTTCNGAGVQFACGNYPACANAGTGSGKCGGGPTDCEAALCPGGTYPGPSPTPTIGPTPTPGGGGGGGGQVCAWCTNQATCDANNPPCTWGGTSSYCSAAGDGCCDCGQQNNLCNITGWSVCVGSPATQLAEVSDWIASYCGPRPTRACTGTIRLRSVLMNAGDITDCASVINAANGAVPTSYSFTNGSAEQLIHAAVQTGNNAVQLNNMSGGLYTLVPQPPVNYVLKKACWTKTLNAPLSGEGLSSSLSIPSNGTSGNNNPPGETLSWYLAYTLGSPWAQTQGGDVYAAADLNSYVPSGVTPRYFNLDGAVTDGGNPGIVTYGLTYDFDGDPFGTSPTLANSKSWITNDTSGVVDYYQQMYSRFGGPKVTDPSITVTPGLDESTPPTAATGRPTPRAEPYYVDLNGNGMLTLTGDWSVGDDENIILLVNGSVTITGKITIDETGPKKNGFVAIMARNDIFVSPTVGSAVADTTPDVEGIYIAGKDGAFHTGASSNAGTERFIGRGTFVAGTFSLERDLDAVGANTTTPAELFIYNPRFLLLLPEAMKDLPVTWREVNP